MPARSSGLGVVVLCSGRTEQITWPELQASPNHNDLSEHIAMATPSRPPTITAEKIARRHCGRFSLTMVSEFVLDKTLAPAEGHDFWAPGWWGSKVAVAVPLSLGSN